MNGRSEAMDRAAARARSVLGENRASVEAVKTALLERGELDGEAFLSVVGASGGAVTSEQEEP